MRDSLPDEVAKTVAVSIVTTRLDFCNSLYYGMSDGNFSKLQRIQNTLARVVVRKRKFEHVTPSLKELHWLPIQQRVSFKIATLTYTILHTREPAYLFELLQRYQPIRTFRSSSHGLLHRTRTRTVIATRAFKHSSVSVWNNLPADVRNCDTICGFRRRLKTVLFDSAFTT